MDASTVTSKGQVTIPKEIRRALGIRQGSRVVFTQDGARVELRVVHQPPEVVASGFGMLESLGKRLAPDFDPALLLAPKTAPRTRARSKSEPGSRR